METKPSVIFVCGTRPDAIKTAPAVLAFQKHANVVDTVLISTGQHREMLAQALGSFGLTADVDLEIMTPGQTLAMVTSRALEGLDQVFEKRKPAMVFGQGDTTTTFVAGLAAFYRQIPFGHIEAGLRTETVWNPFPEEFNRRAVAMFAAQHYAPTEWSANNLRQEGVDDSSIFVTGNTGIDAVQMISEQAGPDWYSDWTGRVVLLTTHRRENWGAPQQQIARAARSLVEAHRDVKLVVAMHRNPVVRETLVAELGGVPRVELIEPPDYAPFVHLIKRSSLILTDSGGVQEEAPSFGVPVLVLRTTTERPEGVDAGTARLVGTNENDIFEAADAILSDPAAHAAMSRAVSPYGDGKAGDRIAAAALTYLGITP
ncbi:MAG: UDP-N-acetylglucosamine 2-epimerase (non-hydrolyzing) [Fimbriimonadaceae bacterium]|nr:UDP-N-acetylglucosamine 2-epimerase (non-hydrolyzing) [Fimbriimonadaceae bacterium]